MQTQSSAPPPPPTPTAVIGVTISQFNPIGAIYSVSYQLTLISGDPSIFQLVNGKLTIRVPVGTEVLINYQLADIKHVLLGIALKSNGTAPGGGVGRQEFPTITLNRDTNGSTMAVLDESLPASQTIDYSYVILVQQVSTGFIGVIDPDIENDPP
jgi:hypothetical protein